MKIFLHFCTLVLSMTCLSCRADDVKVDRDVVYGEADGQKLLLDVFRPAASQKEARPAVIFIHGGGWKSGNKEAYRDWASQLAAKGYVTFSLNYRLTDGSRNRWPAQLDDVQLAVRWIRSRAVEYGIDPQRIGAIGHSAGGHLAAFLGIRETRDTSKLAEYSSRVQCVVDMSGPTDLVKVISDPSNGIVRDLLGGTRQEQPAKARDASPLYFVNAESAPFLLLHGSLDDLVPVAQGQRLDAALRKAGVESQLIEFKDDGHNFARPENSQKAVAAALDFFKKHLRP